MTTFIDNKILHAIERKELSVNEEIVFGWPSLLEYLGCGSLLEVLPQFDQEKLYSDMMVALDNDASQDVIIVFYEQLFAEMLTQVKGLKEAGPGFLLENIQKKPSDIFALPLAHYEKMLQEYPQQVLHDLILYLAWDRVCVAVAILFERSSSNARIRQGLDTLKACLIDSFQHITEGGKSMPSVFRLMEAFYAYQMREDNLQSHTDAEWLILCQGARALKSREVLPDAYTIDAAIIPLGHQNGAIKVYTADSEEKVRFGQALARHIMKSIQREFPAWQYSLSSVDVVYETLR